MRSLLDSPPVPGGGGNTIAMYCGHSVAAVNYNGLSDAWVALATKLTIIDTIQQGIVRTGSDFQFTAGGIYRAQMSVNFTGDAAILMGLRLRDVAAAATIWQSGFGNTISSTTNQHVGANSFRVLDGQVLQLQGGISAGATIANLPALTIAGEPLRNAQIEIYRLN